MNTGPTPTLFLVPRQRVGELAWQPFVGGHGVENRVLYDAGKTVAGLLRLHPGAAEVSHVHIEGEHHLWILAGTVRVDDTDLPADSYVHVPSHLPHRIVDAGQGSLMFYVFCPSTAG